MTHFFKTFSYKILQIGLLCLLSGLLAFQALAAQAAPPQQEVATETPTATPTATPTFTATPEPTATQTPGYSRPVLVITGYSPDQDVVPGKEFSLRVQIYNSGQAFATNVVVTFSADALFPLQTGGVVALREIDPASNEGILQPFSVSRELWGVTVTTVKVAIAYTDEKGVAYQEIFNLTLPVKQPNYGPAPTATSTPTLTPTPTAQPLQRAQLVITEYEADVSPLQPGALFTLKMKISNLGNADARRVVMVVGGGSIGAGGTPEAGGISGSSGEFTNFAPVGASNLQSLGDLSAGAEIDAAHSLIVNVSTNPGAYPMKISFVYLNAGGNFVSDEQVITLLVYSLPAVDINFYRDPNPIFSGQMTSLPIQVVNLGRKSTVLGNLTVSAAGGMLSNNTSLVGPLDPGGYFTLDANLIPDAAGPLELTFVIDYTDDFNQPRQIIKTLVVDVQEMFFPEEPGMEGEGGGGGGMIIEPAQPETFWQKIWRFILGLFGLDSAPANEQTIPVEGQEGEIFTTPPIKGP